MSERPQLRFGVCYDFRNPPDSGIAMPDLYQAALRQIRSPISTLPVKVILRTRRSAHRALPIAPPGPVRHCTASGGAPASTNSSISFSADKVVAQDDGRLADVLHLQQQERGTHEEEQHQKQRSRAEPVVEQQPETDAGQEARDHVDREPKAQTPAARLDDLAALAGLRLGLGLARRLQAGVEILQRGASLGLAHRV